MDKNMYEHIKGNNLKNLKFLVKKINTNEMRLLIRKEIVLEPIKSEILHVSANEGRRTYA
jgi:hypothetical protein